MRNILFAAILFTAACTSNTSDTTSDTARVVGDTSVVTGDTLTGGGKCDPKLVCDSTKM
jgi:hypothetical protein